MPIKSFRRIAQEAALAAAGKKAADIVVLDTRRSSDLADYLVIASVNSSAQMRAVRDAVTARLETLGIRLLRQDGRARDRWLALDYGGMLLHILLPEAREFYRLEHLGEEARAIRWNHGKEKGGRKK